MTARTQKTTAVAVPESQAPPIPPLLLLAMRHVLTAEHTVDLPFAELAETLDARLRAIMARQGWDSLEVVVHEEMARRAHPLLGRDAAARDAYVEEHGVEDAVHHVVCAAIENGLVIGLVAGVLLARMAGEGGTR